MSLILYALLSGCGDDGSGEVFSKDNAPWSMNSASVFLFKPASDNDGSKGNGVLAIGTNATMACGNLQGGIPSIGSGLWFEIGYETGRSAGSASPAWNGLYVSGEGVSTETRAARSLTVAGWHKGFSYSFESTDAWLDVTNGSRDRFAGEFSTQWWSGKFDASVCPAASGQPEDEAGEDTGDTGS